MYRLGSNVVVASVSVADVIILGARPGRRAVTVSGLTPAGNFVGLMFGRTAALNGTLPAFVTNFAQGASQPIVPVTFRYEDIGEMIEQELHAIFNGAAGWITVCESFILD